MPTVTVENVTRSPIVVHPEKGSRAIPPSLSLTEDFTDNEIASMEGHSGLKVTKKEKEDKKKLPGLPGA